MLNNENLSALPLRSRTSQGWLLSPLVDSITPENPAGATRQGKKIKNIQNENEKIKLCPL